MAQYVVTDIASIPVAPASSKFHYRGVCVAAETVYTLGACLCANGLTTPSGLGLPSYDDASDFSRKFYPVSVVIQQESDPTNAAKTLLVTFDGQSSPVFAGGAVLGMRVPLAPGTMEIPCPSGLKADAIKLISGSATTYFQVYFKFDSLPRR